MSLILFCEAAPGENPLCEKKGSSSLESKLPSARSIHPVELYFESLLLGHAKITTTQSFSQTTVTKRFDQKQGYYLEGQIPLPPTNLTFFGSYSHLTIQGNLSFAEKKRVKIRYQTQALGLYRASFLTSLLGVNSVIGAKWAHIEEKKEVAFSTVKKECLDFKGAGPTVGLHLHWSFFDRLSLIANGTGTCFIRKTSKQCQKKRTNVHRNPPLFVPNFCLLVGIQGRFLSGKVSCVVGLDYRKECLKSLNRERKINHRVLGGFSLPFTCRAEDFTTSGLTMRSGITF